ncbi:MAG: DNA integrity scanning diadenylate cyclase DisA [Candidatus Pacearchaeota archaeon]
MSEKIIYINENTFQTLGSGENMEGGKKTKKDLTSMNNEVDLEEETVLKEEEINILDILRFVAPGTALRTALDDILRAELGAIIVFEKKGLSKIISGGFKIDCNFSSQKLVELAKMDGAIILSEDLKKILYANTLLSPDTTIPTKETGTRHINAERTAKQFKTVVIAVSERRNKITLYYGDESFHLEETSEILRRAAETLQILEKQREIFDELLSHLNVLEITNLTTMSDVCNVLQTIEIIRRISENAKRYLVELGKEGTIVSMRLKELTKDLNKNRMSILNDYFNEKTKEKDSILKNMNFDLLLENQNVINLLFEETHDSPISSKGIRILRKTNLSESDIELLLQNFKTLDEIFNLDKDSLKKIFKNDDHINFLMNEIKVLKEKILMGKKI